MNDWASEVFKQVESQRASERLRQETFLEKQRIKKTEGPLLWASVKQHVQDGCRSFNAIGNRAALAVEPGQDDRLVVISRLEDAPRTLRIGFDAGSGRLGWGCEGEFGEWGIEVSLDGKPQFVDKFGVTTPEWAARHMMNALVLHFG